jgi:hypothetical protein
MDFAQIIGVVSEASGVYHIEVGSMQKMVWVDDPRYGDYAVLSKRKMRRKPPKKPSF